MNNLEYNGPRFQKHAQNQKTLVSQTYQMIHDSIIAGRVLPGESLPQEQLAEEMGVSARTVREALSRLVAEGLLVAEPHHSVRVARFTIEDQEELYQMRSVIEGMAAEAAATRITQQELDHLQEIILLASQTNDPSSTDQARHYNEDFHWTIICASGKKQFARALKLIWNVMFTYFEAYEQHEGRVVRREEDILSHKAILKALNERDGEMARKMIQEHIRITFEGQLKYMSEILKSTETAEQEHR